MKKSGTSKSQSNLTLKQISGINLEDLIRFFIADKMGFGIAYDYNSFDPSQYPLANRLIVDGQLGQTILIECTNLKKTTFMDDEKMFKKIEYFGRRDPNNKLCILVVSYANFSKSVKQLLEINGINLVVLGFTATGTNSEQEIQSLFNSDLYRLLKNFREFSVGNLTISFYN